MGILIVSRSGNGTGRQFFATSFRDASDARDTYEPDISIQFLDLGPGLSNWHRATRVTAKDIYDNLILDGVDWINDQTSRNISTRMAQIEFGHLASMVARRLARAVHQIQICSGFKDLEALPPVESRRVSYVRPQTTKEAYDLLISEEFTELIELCVLSKFTGEAITFRFDQSTPSAQYRKANSGASSTDGIPFAVYLQIQKVLRQLSRRNSILVSQSYLGRVSDLLLSALLLQAPLLDEVRPAPERYEISIGPNSLLGPVSTRTLAKTVLQLIMPAPYLVDNYSFASYIDRIGFPPKPNVVFTSAGYAFDDALKRLASERSGDCAFVIGQHGNNYGGNESLNIFPELQVADLFIGWGHYLTGNNTLAFGQLTPGLKRFRLRPVKGVVLMLRGDLRYYVQSELGKINDTYETSVLELCKSLEAQEVRCYLKVAPGSDNEHISHLLTKVSAFRYVQLLEGKKSLKDLASKHLLPVFTYDSTGMLQAANAQLPFFFFNVDQTSHTVQGAPNYDALQIAGLSATNPSEAGVKIARMLHMLNSRGNRYFDKTLQNFCHGLVARPTKRLISLSKVLRGLREEFKGK